LREKNLRLSHILSGLTCLLIGSGFGLGTVSAGTSGPGYGVPDPYAIILLDTVPDRDTLRDRQGNYVEESGSNPFDLQDPRSIEKDVEYDPELDRYIITERIGDGFFRAPTYMTFDEYLDWSSKKTQTSYFQQLNGVEAGDRYASGNVDPISEIDISKDIINRLFGGTGVDIRPQGKIDITLGWDYQKQDNPILPVRQQRTGGFDFDMDIQINVDGKIGEKLNTSFNYNTRSTFDFENKLKLDYNSQEFGEDDILQKIEAGDVTLPLRGTLIQGAQSLFGIKTELQFGHLRLTAIASQQRSQKNDIVIEGGAVLQKFEVPIDEYVQNRNFFLSHFNRETFEYSLGNLPQINSLFRITRMEVWITNNKNQTTNVRDIVAISDFGESRRMTPGNEDWVSVQDTLELKDICKINVLPANQANGMLEFLQADSSNRYVDNATRVLTTEMNLEAARDFEKIRARRLTPTEFNYHPELGFISLNINVQPDQVVGVAFEYTYNGIQFQVGELSDQIPVNPDKQSVLYVKMLKSTIQTVELPIWDIMMKNFYRVGGGDLNSAEFELDVFFEDPGAGFKRFLPEVTGLGTVPLLNVFNLDKLNTTGDPQPDGRFDFVEGLTIYPRAGYMMFPVLEPFGSSLSRIMNAAGTPQATIDSFVYQQLYDSTLIRAQEFPEQNRFTIKGESKSSTSSEISLGTFNIPRNSVQVYAGGQRLIENQDYVIDYNIGRLKILNESLIQPGTPIRVSFEDNALFSFQKKTMLGLRADYEVSDNLFIGGTLMQLFERPYTQKVNIGDDPINNKIYGLDMTYGDDAPWLTRFVDKIPGLSTKAPSSINFQAEFAALRPGHSKAISGNDGDGGVVYLDDFEGTNSGLDLRVPENRWQLSSVPKDVRIEGRDFFPESVLVNDLNAGVNRALLNWYRIDRSVRTGEDQSNPYTQTIDQQEIFRGRTPRFGANDFRTLDLTFYPQKRGAYNFDVPGGSSGYSEGLNDQCELIAPQTRWGGMQRDLQNTDFEQANYEFIEFWMLDPYLRPEYGNTELAPDSYLVFNLGNISEDVLPDGRLFYEHGMPRDSSEAETDTTAWGRIPKIQPVVNAFGIDVESRIQQDIGYDGWNDEEELAFYSDYIDKINNSNLPLDCKQKILQDPSNDNFLYFRDPAFPPEALVFERYEKFNNPENNSPATARTADISANTNLPNNEDLNGDLSLQEGEQYYQYVIKMSRRPDGKPEFVSIGKDVPNQTLNWQQDTISAGERTWYRFKIPIDQGKSVGGINGFRSIRFIRMYMTGFDQQTTLRFATLDLVRSQWRRYTRSECFGDDNLGFSIDAVNVEENSAKTPFNYVIPAGIIRERIVGSTFQDVFQNEQSLSLQFCGLEDECDVRVYKQLDLDLRVYKRLLMFSHLESSLDPVKPEIGDGEVKLFIRLGSDFESNYYEYELPLTTSADLSKPDDATEIWKPDTNDVDFELKELTDLKIERNNSGAGIGDVYEQQDPGPGQRYTLRIKGNPTLGYVKNVMVGVRNPSGGQANLCGEVWINELRLAGLDESGGVAALARLDMNLADFGNVGFSTTYSSIGYGAIDKKLDDRAKESTFQFDASAGLELGKFFGKEAGVSIPFYAQYSTTIKTPQFDPIDLDLELKDKLERSPTKEIRDSIREQAQDVTTLTVVNFTNVRKQKKSQGKPMPWDINNFSVSYSYSNSKAHNEIIENNQVKQHKGQLNYNYSFPKSTLQPLKNLSKSKWLKPITELNLNLLPSSFSFNSTIDRKFGETSYRFSDPIFKTWFNKRFIWDRSYNLRWDFTKSLTFDFNATNAAVIDEPDEYVNRPDGIRITDKERRDSIWTNIKKFGRTKLYAHDFRLNYRVPTNLFPFLDWMRADASYNANYSWTAASLNTDSLGNVIQNGNNIQLTGDLDFVRLYNKSKFLAKINGRSSRARKTQDPRSKQKEQSSGAKVAGGDVNADKKKDRDNSQPSTFAKIVLRPLMMIRKFRITYSRDRSTVLPGYNQESRLLGMNNFDGPGLDFVAGFQPDIGRFEDSSGDWLEEIGIDGKNWVVDNVFQAQPLFQNDSKTTDMRLSLEIFADFKIELDGKKTLSNNFTMFYKNTDKTEITFERLSPRETGSYTMTFFSAQTLFKGSREEVTDLFRLFEQYREEVSQDRGVDGSIHDFDGEAYTFGFGSKQRDILVPAFIAAYTKKDPKNFELTDMFGWIPRPNWQLTYNGLQKVGNLSEIFSSIRISHGYKSVLTINSFQTDLNYKSPQINDNNINNATRDYFSRYVVPTIGLVEEFSPLIGIDIRTKNDMNFRFNYAKRRGLSMGFVSYELAETRATTVELGFNYKLRDVELSFLPGFKGKKDQTGKNSPGSGRGAAPARGNDLEFLFDFSWSDNITFNHYLDQESLPQPTRGSKDVSISPAIRYNLNKFINLRLFVDYRKTFPYTTTGYPITIISGGLTVQVILE
jgi:cell surface protein SprA